MANIFCLKGKKAIITGGSQGLGLGITKSMLEAGADVCIIAIGDALAKAVADFKAQGYNVWGVECDISKKEALEKGFAEALENLGGKIDILVNNAGIQRRNKCEDFLYEDWLDVIQINLTAVFTLCQLAGREMLKAGSGKIINMASMLSFFGGQTVPAYSASKGGVAQLTKAFSNEWSGRGVNVNAIAPGYMDTEMNVALINNPDRNSQILARIPMERWGKPEDIGGVAVFLASEAANYVTGAVIPVDGGYLSK
ncbi:glucose 1-dehydrogenase [Candidatus Epulonipiscium viviparus]|uniref:glucose 1-dehydrogenase n=1 Tax=Candidatus Epulonipiscium viviparus TaxID=420336 RepID=UPI00016BFB4F|nr:glucose 1-dehydrogenase [Candidatus Epulopiscium viviparus]